MEDVPEFPSSQANPKILLSIWLDSCKHSMEQKKFCFEL